MRCTLALAAATARRCPSIRRSVTSISPSRAATSARARWTANSYGRGSMTMSRSPCFTGWLSLTCSSVIVPLTCGTTPMMSAVTTASSVCGCCTERRMTTTARRTAPATMPKPMYLPSAPRRSLISAAEDDEPRGEDPQSGETRVDEGRGAKVRRDLRRDERLAGENREHDPDDDADQPCREERAQDVDGRRHAAAGEREKDGDGEPSRQPDGRRRRCPAGIEHGHPFERATSRCHATAVPGQSFGATG